MTQPSIEQILIILKDRQWHDINEIAKKTQLSSRKIKIITEFLAKYNFIEIDRESQKIKISYTFARFLHAISSVKTEKVC